MKNQSNTAPLSTIEKNRLWRWRYGFELLYKVLQHLSTLLLYGRMGYFANWNSDYIFDDESH